MGGCRCSYRNCTVKSDGTTHMFHYPVFDKVRCHQWLTKAHRLEFLNLKVSQLKNRVICQHHFEDKCFMNFKKDKLTFYAVPTIDGPYCDATLYDIIDSDQTSKMYQISLEDIENEHLTLIDKKANFSVKYGNFLTNGDMMDFEPINNVNNNTYAVDSKKENYNIQKNSSQQNTIVLNENQKDSLITVNIEPVSAYANANPVVIGIDFEELQLSSRKTEEQDFACLLSTPFQTRSNIINDEKKIVKEINAFSTPLLTTNNIINNANNIEKESKVLSNPLLISNTINNENTTGKDNKVRIISEKKISNHIKVPLDLEPLSPSLTIRVPKNKIFKSRNKELDISNDNNKISSTKVLDNTVSVEPEKKVSPSLSQMVQENNSSPPKNTGKSSRNVTNKNTYSPSRSLLKNKNDPDRVAAIEEKRKFNMKLRDIIESCLDKIDEQEKTYDENLEKNDKIQQQGNAKVGAFLSKEKELPSLQEYTIACLEGRIQRMENLLLNRIDQNSKRILELKNSISSTGKQSTSVEKTKNTELHKRRLYKEISAYLSPEANSLIYEELFINKYVEKASKSSPSPKRRKKR